MLVGQCPHGGGDKLKGASLRDTCSIKITSKYSHQIMIIPAPQEGRQVQTPATFSAPTLNDIKANYQIAILADHVYLKWSILILPPALAVS